MKVEINYILYWIVSCRVVPGRVVSSRVVSCRTVPYRIVLFCISAISALVLISNTCQYCRHVVVAAA